jgi:hypothetical protein
MHQGRLVSFGRPQDLAAARWPGLEVRLDLGAPAAPHLVDRLLEQRCVHAVVTDANGAVVNVNSRDDIPAVVAIAVGAGALVYGTEARAKGLEDVYFAVQEELGLHADLVGAP